MSNQVSLVNRNFDKDLLILEDLEDDCNFPERNWESIISIYEQSNPKFPISPLKCIKIIKDVKNGRIPKTVFTSQGVSYINFRNRANKSKKVLEQMSEKINNKLELTEQDWMAIQICRNDPAFILSQDIDRARAFHFNDATDKLKEHSDQNAPFWLAYMKEVHKEEFEEKKDNKSIDVTVHFGAGILESI